MSDVASRQYVDIHELLNEFGRSRDASKLLSALKEGAMYHADVALIIEYATRVTTVGDQLAIKPVLEEVLMTKSHTLSKNDMNKVQFLIDGTSRPERSGPLFEEE